MPELYWVGDEGEYNVMIMELLGPSLEELFTYCGKKFHIKTAIMAAYQMVYKDNSFYHSS
jgi:hypothetical protein